MDKKTLLTEIGKRSLPLRPLKLVASPYPGEWSSSFEGRGFEPLRFRDAELSDNPRRIHLVTSVRRGVPTVVERVQLSDFRVAVAIDCSASMFARNKMLTQVMVAAIVLHSAFKLEIPFGLGVNRPDEFRSFGFGVGIRHFHYLYDNLWDILGHIPKTFSVWQKGANAKISNFMPFRSMLVYCSDFLIAQGELVNVLEIGRKMRRYDFVPVVIQDRLEFSFPVLEGGSLVPLSNPETGREEEVWINKDEAEKIRLAHENRFSDLCLSLARFGGSCHLDEPDIQRIWERLDAFFSARRG